jgi:hypothetical protein
MLLFLLSPGKLRDLLHGLGYEGQKAEFRLDRGPREPQA